MASILTSTARNTQFNSILSDFKRELSQDEIHNFGFISSMDLKASIHQLQEEQKSGKRMQNLRRLSAFIEAMDQFDKVVHVILNATDYLGFIWGPAKFMLLVASSYTEALNTLLDAYQEIGEHMPLLGQYEMHINNSPYLQELVGLIYKDILTFHRKAMKHFRQRAWKKLFNATWRTFRTDFGAIISNLQSHRRLLDSQAIFLGVQETMKVMKELHEGRRTLEAECVRRRDEDDKYRQHAVASWLSAADSISDHEEALAVHDEEPESGQWLFQQRGIDDWINPHSPSDPILWVNGKPGAGKTILASYLIKKCRKQPNCAVAYFYCKHGDPSRDNFIGLAQSLIFQLTKLNSLLLPFVLEKRAITGTDSLRSPKVAKEILAAAVESSGDLIFVFDGLDECIMSQKKEIVSWARSAVASTNTGGSKHLRCCFFSQEDNDTGRLLRDVATFKITEQHNSDDISRFCRRRANAIKEAFGLTPQEAKNLAKHVAEHADGMFLYAKLVMDNLEGQVSKAALYHEMEQIPPDLNQVYIRIKHRILDESSPPERRVATTLLSWLLCAKRPLKWHEIQGAMSLNLENDTFDCDRRLIKGIKDFCGSLIEVRKGGAICFVHLTAKYFLQNEPRLLPTALENVHLTRLCFSHLSLASHASDNGRDSIRQCILRGEYAFTEYATIHAFDHLLDVLSEAKEAASSNHEVLKPTLRKFVTTRVTAPTTRAPADKPTDIKLQIFKSDDFYNDIRHAIVYHRESLKKSATDREDDAVLTLLQHLSCVRSELERMITCGPTDHIKTLYGQELFKCSEPLCESFHTGFSAQRLRDNHRGLHDRIHLCSSSGCSSAMIGFSSLSALQKHEQNYHREKDAEISFPWHGTLETMNISEEIKRGNYSAFELWLSQWEGFIPQKKFGYGRSQLLETAANYNQNRMLDEMLLRLEDSYAKVTCIIPNVINISIRAANTEAVRNLMKQAQGLEDTHIYRFLMTSLRYGRDDLAEEVLKHPMSHVHGHSNIMRKASYLNLAVRYGRDTLFAHILDEYQANPELQDDKGRTSLIAAAEFNRTDIAMFLIKTKNCDKWAARRNGDTPLQMAGRQGHEDFISSVFHDDSQAGGAHVGEIREWLRVAQLRNAARNGDDTKVRELLNGDLPRVDELDRHHRSP